MESKSWLWQQLLDSVDDSQEESGLSSATGRWVYLFI